MQHTLPDSSRSAADENNHYLTVDEAADILGVHHMTVRKMINAKEIPAVRVGRLIRIPSTALAELPSAA